MKYKLALLCFVLAMGSVPHFVSKAQAEPGDSCTSSDDCDDGERCKKKRGDDEGECVARNSESNQRQRGGENMSREPMYCLDNFGRRWCQIATSVGRPGDPCYCNGIPGVGHQGH
jgi:hypothetical protein